MNDVSVRLSGHDVLRNISLDIAPGEHVAVVGASGAGKSTLVGLLLGWSTPSSGAIDVDGMPLAVETLRHETAWVDPAIQVWNRSLLENLTYGSDVVDTAAFGTAVNDADLLSLLYSLPQGLQTQLGEGGGLVSGGEGQRVRLARSMCRTNARLVVLDEPFRGLDRPKRSLLLERARKLWSQATLLCVTHDISETESFDRVVVIDNGRMIEQGKPAELAAGDTRYASLLRADAEARASWWRASWWRQVQVEGGALVERG